MQVQSWLQASNNIWILNTCTRLWLTESEHVTPHGFNKGLSSKFRVGSLVWQRPEEGWRTYQPKHCGNNNKDEDNSLKTFNDKKKAIMKVLKTETLTLPNCSMNILRIFLFINFHICFFFIHKIWRSAISLFWCFWFKSKTHNRMEINL